MAKELRIAPACDYVFHLTPIQIAHKMNFFYHEALRDEDGKPSYNIVSGSMAPLIRRRDGYQELHRNIGV